MQTLHLDSSDEVRERIDTLEDAELIDGTDIEVWYADGGEEFRIIREVEITKLGLRYVNDGEADELSDARAFADTARSAEAYWRE